MFLIGQVVQTPQPTVDSTQSVILWVAITGVLFLLAVSAWLLGPAFLRWRWAKRQGVEIGFGRLLRQHFSMRSPDEIPRAMKWLKLGKIQDVGLDDLEEHFRVGGQVTASVAAMRAARESGLDVSWGLICQLDLSGHDPRVVVARATESWEVEMGDLASDGLMTLRNARLSTPMIVRGKVMVVGRIPLEDAIPDRDAMFYDLGLLGRQMKAVWVECLNESDQPEAFVEDIDRMVEVVMNGRVDRGTGVELLGVNLVVEGVESDPELVMHRKEETDEGEPAMEVVDLGGEDEEEEDDGEDEEEETYDLEERHELNECESEASDAVDEPVGEVKSTAELRREAEEGLRENPDSLQANLTLYFAMVKDHAGLDELLAYVEGRVDKGLHPVSLWRLLRASLLCRRAVEIDLNEQVSVADPSGYARAYVELIEVAKVSPNIREDNERWDIIPDWKTAFPVMCEEEKFWLLLEGDAGG